MVNICTVSLSIQQTCPCQAWVILVRTPGWLLSWTLRVLRAVELNQQHIHAMPCGWVLELQQLWNAIRNQVVVDTSARATGEFSPELVGFDIALGKWEIYPAERERNGILCRRTGIFKACLCECIQENHQSRTNPWIFTEYLPSSRTAQSWGKNMNEMVLVPTYCWMHLFTVLVSFGCYNKLPQT